MFHAFLEPSQGVPAYGNIQVTGIGYLVCMVHGFLETGQESCVSHNVFEWHLSPNVTYSCSTGSSSNDQLNLPSSTVIAWPVKQKQKNTTLVRINTKDNQTK